MRRVTSRSFFTGTLTRTALVVALISTTSVLKAATLPDLTVISVSAPSTGVTGTAVQIVVTVQNLTNSATLSTTRVYLRTNNVASGTEWYSYTIFSLGPGATHVKTNSQTIATSTTLGTNYVIAVCGNGINEVTKANNTNSTVMVVNPQ